MEAILEAMMEASHHDIKVSIQRVDQVLEPRVHRAAPRIPPVAAVLRKGGRPEVPGGLLTRREAVGSPYDAL